MISSNRNIRVLPINESKSDVDLSKKIKVWEDFYNFIRPNKAHGGLTLYEKFRVKLNINIQGQAKSEIKQCTK